MPNYIERFLKHSIKSETGCWLWLGAINNKSGHGLVTVDGKVVYLHRFIYCNTNNLSYDGKFLICHKTECNTPNCWNPEHLYVGDHSTNMLDRVESKTHHEANKTHCPQGHEYNVYNTRTYNNKRYCLECRRIRDRNRKRLTVNGYRITISGTRKI